MNTTKKPVRYTSKQQIFYKVWKYFITEKNPQSINSVTDACRYLHKGQSCAIGCLIEDDDTRRHFDRQNKTLIENIRLNFPEKLSLYIHPNIPTSFLSKLQTIHDSHFSEFESKMRNLAQEYNLKIPKN